ncbi:MAG: peroxiredoxin, partial [Hyphomicrobiaceae bacterium]|nr:peroxiredoxin [Hyphomicrobiaceae bacterium]
RLPGRVVLYVYPWSGRPGVPNPPRWDDIPGAHGSTPQAEAFAALHEQYQAAGITVLGLSGQSADWQAEFATRCRLPFPLLSDEPLALRAALDLPVFVTGGVTYLERLTIVLRDGMIETVVQPITDPPGHPAALLLALNSAA